MKKTKSLLKKYFCNTITYCHNQDIMKHYLSRNPFFAASWRVIIFFLFTLAVISFINVVIETALMKQIKSLRNSLAEQCSKC